MFAGAFLNSTPCPPALGCLLLVSLHDLLVDVNGLLESRIPSLAGKLSGVFGSAKTGLRTHCPYFCAWFEVGSTRAHLSEFGQVREFPRADFAVSQCIAVPGGHGGVSAHPARYA